MSKYLKIIFLTIIFGMGEIAAGQKPTICLNMIVKNESKVIRKCLTSVRPLIDYWVIVDTGSTDGTQDVIREFMKDVPGELHEQEWINFAHNRNGALEQAKHKGDYVLFIDADEILEFDEGFTLPELTHDYYYITTKYASIQYVRNQLIKNALNWKWVGVLHEYLTAPEAHTNGILTGVYNVPSHDGARSQDPLKFQKDAALLEEALKEEPHNVRYQFYLAQSYRDAQDYPRAIESYKKRIAMGGFDQEIFWSKLQIGLLQDALEEPAEDVIKSYNEAYLYRPTRAEPLYRLAEFYRRSNNFLAGYLVAREGLQIKLPNDVLFVEQWIYDYGLLLEYSVSAYWIGKYAEAKKASDAILAVPNLPDHVRQCVEKNLEWIHPHLETEKKITEIKNLLSKQKSPMTQQASYADQD